jgi:uncharacterized protein (TIGR02284 family)
MFFSIFTPDNTTEVVGILHQLISACQDSARNLRTAAEGINNDLLTHLFASYAEQRTHFAIALNAEARRQGSTTSPAGSVSGALQRGWINIKAALTRGDEKTLVHECIASEHATLETYQQARRTNLPADILNLINRQYDELKLVHTNIRRIEERLEILI